MSEPTATKRPVTRGSKEAGPATDDEIAGRLRLAVLRLARRLRQQSPPGITPSQLSALSVIHVLGSLTIGELAAHENVQPPTISRIVDALEAAGWVERFADDTDRRVARVRATPQAERELARIRAERNAYLADRFDRLDPDERRALVAALPALEHLLREADG